MNVSVQMTEKRMKKIQKNRRKTGADYEKAAGFYLEQMGYEILQFNYRCRLGEIDLIAKDGAYYVFCEVKYRADERKVPASGRGRGIFRHPGFSRLFG